MKKKLKTINVVGARPNFMKIAPIWHEQVKESEYFDPLILHTGQHYDKNMSDAFFTDLELPSPDIYLGVGSGSHAVQTADVMVKFEEVCLKENPDLVIVVGDVNSTLACSLVAAKMRIPVAHVEAGLRSFDRTMPEEINRKLTDSISDLLFTTSVDADENLKNEGISSEKIFFVGNVMIDTLLKFKQKAVFPSIVSGPYAVLTLHRPVNVDDRQSFSRIVEAVVEISSKVPVVFPVHPRTWKQIQVFGLDGKLKQPGIKIADPLSYLEFLGLMAKALFVLTDSGGIQEETTVLQVPCLTLRENTERPVTVTEGTNLLLGTNRELIISESLKIINGKGKTGLIPKFWDGKAAERIIKVLKEQL
ncbi:UDP-N-acetylglucosamine 2-epimerase (non-hydrolyzing) [Candidatus Saganbacteria bacterium CG08_land_8_20_14_0_20_45_16]|uniref:UDP-N-acetylglucosamine 2-epimerase (Non-hydrolyzing) n=1 Tax=Candidatus Saganbacteria bacterium CG08_land_8_20_14_0_20_45_16 TaxID=2014293 RepID=A0A2H0Y192_UNCSA|nr:MAG: UDP-N-acetylglucosamine 2-epimerase (non-hydrolyzing) [Candidatus Saganbacteria bacterium CG08_land_8_20_14_0_20_45_16]